MGWTSLILGFKFINFKFRFNNLTFSVFRDPLFWRKSLGDIPKGFWKALVNAAGVS
jgi:hypothetical protein